jgi:hypothetical protein
MDFAALARRVGKLANDNSPAILTAIGAVGAITTAYFAGKAAWNVATEVTLRENEEPVKFTAREKIDVIRDLKLWREFIPAVGVGCLTVACIVGANRVGARRAAGLAAASIITEKTLDEYKTKVRETLGEKKEEKIRDEVMQDRVDTTYHDGIEVYGAEAGELCYDKYSDRYFRSSVEEIKRCENEFNHRLLRDGYASLAELYDLLGLPSTAYSYEIGWRNDNLLDIRIVPVMSTYEKPCIGIEFRQEPTADYGRFR